MSVKLLDQLFFEPTRARRYRIINAYDETTQRLMNKMEAGGFIFDIKLKSLVEDK